MKPQSQQVVDRTDRAKVDDQEYWRPTSKAAHLPYTNAGDLAEPHSWLPKTRVFPAPSRTQFHECLTWSCLIWPPAGWVAATSQAALGRLVGGRWSRWPGEKATVMGILAREGSGGRGWGGLSVWTTPHYIRCMAHCVEERIGKRLPEPARMYVCM